MADKFICALTGPTYSGKTTLSSRLEAECGFLFPKQSTTRPQRLDDKEDEYRYLSVEEFERLKAMGLFLFASGNADLSYGILKDDIYDAFAKSDNVLIHISYENLDDYRKIDFKKALIALTYQSLEEGIIKRALASDRRALKSELDRRIMIARYLHDTYFDEVQSLSDEVICTDIYGIEETFDIARRTIRKKKGN